ncbi:hypothetical protein GGF44_000074 [Coemansia sp. RSA 1694]|nr:hypothetical protein GGF44_000074 [Coemansia sp. RSA 1694]
MSMSSTTDSPLTPESTITVGVLGEHSGTPSPAFRAIHATDHDMATAMVSVDVAFGDPSYQRYLHSAAAAADLGIGDSLENICMPNSDPATGGISAFHYLVGSPPSPSGVLPASTLFSDPPSDSTRMLCRSTRPDFPPHRRGSLSLSCSHPYIPALDSQGRTAQRRVNGSGSSCSSLQPPATLHLHRQLTTQTAKSRTIVIPAINQDGTFKKCTNCMTATTPSWRRHPDTQALLCNACGLYLRLHRKPRPITIDDSGNVQVIRKNAAVQREPMNLPSSSMYAFGSTVSGNSSTSSLTSINSTNIGSSGASNDVSASFDQLRHDQPPPSLLLGSFAFPGYQVAQRTNTSLASIQGMSEPFLAMELHSPMPHVHQQHSQGMLQISEVIAETKSEHP